MYMFLYLKSVPIHVIVHVLRYIGAIYIGTRQTKPGLYMCWERGKDEGVVYTSKMSGMTWLTSDITWIEILCPPSLLLWSATLPKLAINTTGKFLNF